MGYGSTEFLCRVVVSVVRGGLGAPPEVPRKRLWHRAQVIDFDFSVVQAPMAGGPSTPTLAAAVSNAGGLGFLAAGYKTPETVLADITATRELTRRPFGVNVFVPSIGPADRDAVRRYTERLLAQAAALGVVLGDPRFDDDHYQQKVELLAQ